MVIDVFNGDADGLCALIQLRLAEPVDSVLVTGVKRDISLLKRVNARSGDRVTVLDVSLDKNRQPLMNLLENDVEVFYVDHHRAGDIPGHPKLKALIDTDANICTSLLVDQYLHHRYTAWAVTAAFGDNLEQSALAAAQRLSLPMDALDQLRQLGICLNYNGYGASEDDLYFSPAQLFRLMKDFASPFDFIVERNDIFRQLQEGYASDMAMAEHAAPEYLTDKVAVFILPDAKWARRVSGVWSNDLTNRHPARAHAVLTPNQTGGYTVSVRAPLHNKVGADEVCSMFPTGGGRKAAAGIDNLGFDQLHDFIQALVRFYF